MTSITFRAQQRPYSAQPVSRPQASIPQFTGMIPAPGDKITRRQLLTATALGLFATACGGGEAPATTTTGKPTTTARATTSSAASSPTGGASTTAPAASSVSEGQAFDLSTAKALINVDHPDEVIQYFEDGVQHNADGSITLPLRKRPSMKRVTVPIGPNMVEINSTHTSGRFVLPIRLTEGRVDVEMTVPIEAGDHSTAFLTADRTDLGIDISELQWPAEIVIAEFTGQESKDSKTYRTNPITGYWDPADYDQGFDPPKLNIESGERHVFSIEVRKDENGYPIFRWYFDNNLQREITVDEILQSQNQNTYEDYEGNQVKGYYNLPNLKSAQLDGKVGFTEADTRAQLQNKVWNLAITHAAGPAWPSVGTVPDNYDSDLVIHSVRVSP